MAIEYMDSATAAELGWSKGNSANADWVNREADPEGEYQPDLDPPRIPDYANLRKHPHYRQYFRTYKFRPFPAWVYHPTKEPVIVKSKEEALALGPEWSPTPFETTHNMVGKTLPSKTQQEQLNENIRTLVAARAGGNDVAATSLQEIAANAARDMIRAGASMEAVNAVVAAIVGGAGGSVPASALAAKPADSDKGPELELPSVLDRRSKK